MDEAKKEALIAGNKIALKKLSKRIIRSNRISPSTHYVRSGSSPRHETACHERAPEGRVEWTCTTPNRTALDFPFRFRIYQQKSFLYQALGAKAKALKAQGLSWTKGGKWLGITDKTAKKAAIKVSC